MTYKEALEMWQTRKRMVQMQCVTCWSEDGELALRALEKQVPIRLKADVNNNNYIKCSCGLMIPRDITVNRIEIRKRYCSKCGQLLEYETING